MMHTYWFLPADLTEFNKFGVVTVEPVTDNPMLADTGPAFWVTFIGESRSNLAYLDELTPIGDAPEPEWGDWWDMVDEKSVEALASYDEAGVWLTRRQVYEASMDAAHRRVWARERNSNGFAR